MPFRGHCRGDICFSSQRDVWLIELLTDLARWLRCLLTVCRSVRCQVGRLPPGNKYMAPKSMSMHPRSGPENDQWIYGLDYGLPGIAEAVSRHLWGNQIDRGARGERPRRRLWTLRFPCFLSLLSSCFSELVLWEELRGLTRAGLSFRSGGVGRQKALQSRLHTTDRRLSFPDVKARRTNSTEGDGGGWGLRTWSFHLALESTWRCARACF